MSDEILEELAKKSITYGIDYSAIESIIQNPELAKNILVAMGYTPEKRYRWCDFL